MKLSVVIVNYNVAHFLEQCLMSVFASQVNFDYEVYVVDNHSVDGSVAMLKEKFPQVKLIENKKNLGFSRANNQALRQAAGEYVLLLNPDTLIEPDTLQLTVDFMDSHPDAGGLGVMMLDGKGNFLPESKRGLPTPAAAFYKIFGFSKLFPRSKRFSAYHLGHLDKNEIHEIEVLSGAFMMMRKKALDEVGLLDEDFFMYGEDIDLSYRLLKGGYKNYYFPGTRIIHYKGESTKKDSVNYVFVFYNAMIIFARKHFSEKNARIFSFLINLAIVLKAGMSLVGNFIKKLMVAFVDILFIYSGLWFFAKYWGTHFAGQHETYPPVFLYLVIPVFVVIDLLSVYYSGGYDKPIRPLKILQGHIWGILITFVIYAFLPENFRFSRALLLFAFIYIPAVMLLWRFAAKLMKIKGFEFGNSISRRIVLIGGAEEAGRVEDVLSKTGLKIEKSVTVDPADETMEGIAEVVKINKINEVIFCAKDLTSTAIIEMMSALQSLNVDFKIAPPESLFIVGSNSINTAGDIYFKDVNTIGNPGNLRFKRLFDFLTAVLLTALFPVTFFFFKRPLNYLLNLLKVLFNVVSFVGFDELDSGEHLRLPKLKKGILHPSDGISRGDLSDKSIARLNIIYAREYNVFNDIKIVVRGFGNLDRKI
jgi:GT2 family glycosyltransferase